MTVLASVPASLVIHLHTVQFGGDLPPEVIHLEADQAMGSTLCGIELFPRNAAGKLIPRGWGRRGGSTGPNRVPCAGCRDAVPTDRRYVVLEDRTFNLNWRKPTVSG